MFRYLVTGGAGFIGSHVVDALATTGNPVRVVDDLSTGFQSNIPKNNLVEFIKADLAEPGVSEAAVTGVKWVIHLAAIPSVPRSILEPAQTHRANVEATHSLLLAARDAGVRRFVQASSSSVYGESKTLPKHEEMAPHPVSPYGLHKLIAERYANLFTNLYGLETVSLRFFNVFGPRQAATSQYSGVISLFTAALLSGQTPTIYGDGEQTRDFTFVSDVATAVIGACESPSASGRVINIAGGHRTSINELYGILQRTTKTNIPPYHTNARAGDIKDSQADISVAKKVLNFQPKISVEDGLQRTVEWHRSKEHMRT